MEMSIDYPTVVGMQNQMVQRNINSRIFYLVNSLINEQIKSLSIKDMKIYQKYPCRDGMKLKIIKEAY